MEAARLMARGDFQKENEDTTHAPAAEIDESLAAFGLYAEAPVQLAEQPTPTFYLWPESVAAFAFWRTLQSQWRHGMDGPTGLDYSGVWAVLNNTVQQRQRKALFEDITHLEAGALQGMAQLRAERESQQN